MTPIWIIFICAAAIIVCGLVAGVFMAFSDFIMKSLALASAEAGTQAMRLINRKVYGSTFLTMFMCMAPVSLLMGAYAYLRLSGPAAVWIMAGAAIYIIGVFLVTILFNVPMNKRLDRMDMHSAETASYWMHYTKRWTFWNHVRTIGSIGAMGCYLMGALLLSRGVV